MNIGDNDRVIGVASWLRVSNMTTSEEFKNGTNHNVDYGELGKKIIELRDNKKVWEWVETQNYSEFEKGIAVGFMIAWIEIFVNQNYVKK